MSTPSLYRPDRDASPDWAVDARGLQARERVRLPAAQLEELAPACVCECGQRHDMGIRPSGEATRRQYCWRCTARLDWRVTPPLTPPSPAEPPATPRTTP